MNMPVIIMGIVVGAVVMAMLLHFGNDDGGPFPS